MIDYSIKNIDQIPTPSLIYYQDIINDNIALAIKIAGNAKRIRPHIKSHKTVEIAKMQQEFGIDKFKSATIAETEMLLAAGFTDVLMAYPLVGPNIRRFITLSQKYPNTRVIGITDNFSCAEIIATTAKEKGITVSLMLDIDSGLHRSGTSFETANGIYCKIATLPEIELLGLHVYDGENKEADAEKRLLGATLVHQKTLELIEKIEKAGATVEHVTMGGTPSFPCHAGLGKFELSPGTCFLQDAGYLSKYPDLPFVPAAIIATRVISITDSDRVTFDVGSKSVASDPPVEKRISLLGDLKVTTLFQNEEHWVVKVLTGKTPKIGDVFYAVPYHVCPTSALYEKIAVVDENRMINQWFHVASRQRTILV